MISHPEKGRRTGIARALSKLGCCSRSQAFGLVRSGRVRLNGKLIRDPETPVRLEKDRIEVDEQAISETRKAYLMLNKPRGVVTTARDEKGRETVYSLLPECRDWIAPIGRLDMASEGLLLFTNDSQWGAWIASAESHIEKTYHVQVATVAGEGLLELLRKGVRTKDGDFLAIARARLLRQGTKNSWLEIVLTEGKNRHIRRLLQELGVDVLRLVRVAIGPLKLGDLPKGKSRGLTKAEVESLSTNTG